MRPPDNLQPNASRLRVALVQMKPLKGRYAENLAQARDAFATLAADPPDLVVLPEGALTGYFLEGAVYDLARSAGQIAADLARTWRDACGDAPVDVACGFFENDGGTYYNSAIYLEIRAEGDRIVHIHHKMFLPTYGVFDEERFLSRGRKMSAFDTHYGRAAILVCEDAWHTIVPAVAAIKGARLLIVPSAAPGRGIEGNGELTSITRWREILRTIAAEHGVYLAYCALTGFEGGKGMTGSSCIISPRGETIVEAPASEACILRADLDLREIDLARASLPLLGDLGAVLPDLFLDDELPLPRGGRDVHGH